MTLQCFNDMMTFLRTEVRRYCGEFAIPITIDEAEGLAFTLGLMAYSIYARPTCAEKPFRAAVEQFVRNEILRVCA